MTTHYLKQARPDDKETEQLWKFNSAIDRIDTRWFGSRLWEVAEELKTTQLSKADRIFLLRAWELCIESGTYNRLFGAYQVWVHNVQDPAANYCKYKPELEDQIEAGGLGIVFEEAYEEARDELAARQGDNLEEELLAVIRKYGWNIDRKNAAAVLNIIMHRLKSFEQVGGMLGRYLRDPELWAIEQASFRPMEEEPEDDETE